MSYIGEQVRSIKNDNEENEEFIQDKRNIWVDKSDIYFYDFIDPETQLLLSKYYNKAVEYIYSNSGEYSIKNNGEPHNIVTLHINSGGGDVFSSLAIYDFLKEAEIPVVGIVEGQAASGASIILQGCKQKLMSPHSMILIHELSSGTFGKLTQMKQDFKNWESMMDLIKDIYRKETKIPEDELDKILEPDYYWKADKCKEYGLVDYIIGEIIQPSKEELEENIKEIENALKQQKELLVSIEKEDKKKKKI